VALPGQLDRIVIDGTTETPDFSLGTKSEPKFGLNVLHRHADREEQRRVAR